MADNVVIDRGGGSGSGGWGILGVIVGVALVVGILALIFAGPQIASWWGDGGASSVSIETPAGSASATTHPSQSP